MAEGQKRAKSPFIALAGAALALGGAYLNYLESQSLREGAKSEIASTDVTVSELQKQTVDLQKRLANLEGSTATRAGLCACFPKAFDMGLPQPPEPPEPEELPPEEEDEPEVMTATSRPEPRPIPASSFRKSPIDDPRVKKRLEGFENW